MHKFTPRVRSSPTKVVKILDQKNVSVIIVAAGSGSRMKISTPKQFLPLGEKLVLMHTIDLFASISEVCEIILVLSSDQFDNWSKLCEKYNFLTPHIVVAGGSSRTESVKNGLNAMKERDGVVLIHDGVRPFVAKEVVEEAISSARKYGAAVPVVDVVDSMRVVGSDSENSAIDRSLYKIVQTPQSFDKNLILKAYKAQDGVMFADDAALLESIGVKIALFEGNRDNIKITTSEDLALSEYLLMKTTKNR